MQRRDSARVFWSSESIFGFSLFLSLPSSLSDTDLFDAIYAMSDTLHQRVPCDVRYLRVTGSIASGRGRC